MHDFGQKILVGIPKAEFRNDFQQWDGKQSGEPPHLDQSKEVYELLAKLVQAATWS